MRRVFPEPAETVEVLGAYHDPERTVPQDRPWVCVSMVASVDGGTAVDGRSAGLGSPADRAVFAAMRALADVILVGAGTARAERYRPPRPVEAEAGVRRAARSQAPRPRLAVVTNRVDVGTDPAWLDDDPRPYVIAPADAAADRLEPLRDRAVLIGAGRQRVDLREALRLLHRDGVRVVTAEGGPSLNAALLAAGLVDEMCVTVSAALLGGGSPRVIGADPAPDLPLRLALAHVIEDDGHLLLRYLTHR